jgi:hypothetical protein
MAEEVNLTNRFKVVGYLQPSNTGKSFKVVVDGRVIGLVLHAALSKSLCARPLLKVEICKFIDYSMSKPTKQTELKFPLELQP